MIIHALQSRVTLEMIYESLLSKGDSVRVKRNKNGEITRLCSIDAKGKPIEPIYVYRRHVNV